MQFGQDEIGREQYGPSLDELPENRSSVFVVPIAPI